MNFIQFDCSHCGHPLETESVHAGRVARCPDCQSPVPVPKRSVSLSFGPEEPPPSALEIGGVFFRILAFVMDSIATGTLSILAVSVCFLIYEQVLDPAVAAGGRGDLMAVLFVLVIPSLVFCGYHAGAEGGRYHATPGKQMFGLTVTDANGKPVSRRRAFARSIFKLVFFPFWALSLLLMLILPRALSLHDLFAHTLVVSRTSH